MGRYVFKLPDVGEGTAAAEIVAWHVKVGDAIEEDDRLVDVMTDKATVEMTSPVKGVVMSRHGEPGEMVTVGAPLVELEVEGAGNVNGQDRAAKAPSAELAPSVSLDRTPPSAHAGLEARGPSGARSMKGDKPLASPAVRRRADELGIRLQYVPGTGPAGRITQADLDAFVGSTQTPNAGRSAHGVREGVEEIKIIGLRRKIAEKMQESKRRIPHFAYVEEIDMTELKSLRAHLNANRRAGQPKLTLLPFLIRGLVRLLPGYPQINSRFDDEAGIVHRYKAVHIGIATQTANGLMVPVVRHAETLDIWQAASEVARLAQAAREGNAARDELSGSTITITSLGALGGVATTPVINHPEVAIIGPNAIRERPVVREGQIVVRKMMNLSSSFDHRVVDGYDAAEFIQKFKRSLEQPATLLME